MHQLHLLAACRACGRQFDAAHEGALGPGDTFRCSCGGEVTVPSARPSDAAVVTCAACGAPRQGGAAGAPAAACSYCGADFTLRERDLDAVCPRCAARVSRKGRFCHHCSLPLTAPRAATPSEHRCPACAEAAPDSSQPGAPEGAQPTAPEGAPGRQAGAAPAAAAAPRPVATPAPAPRLVSRRAGSGEELHLFQCPRCAGVWLDREVFEVLVERTRQGRGGLGTGGAAGAAGAASRPPAPPEAGRGFAYRPCAVCGKLMHRRNYARRSGVILDVCGEHGLWFDADELHRVLAWVRRGGATESELPPLEPERDSRRPPMPLFGDSPGGALGGARFGGDLVADVLAALGGALLRRLT